MKGFSYTSVSSFDTISGYSKEVSGFFYKLFFKKQINQACAPPGYLPLWEEIPGWGERGQTFLNIGQFSEVWEIPDVGHQLFSYHSHFFQSLFWLLEKKNKINNSLQRRLDGPQINHYINKQCLH